MMIHRSRQCFVLFHFLSLILLKSDVGNGLSISSRGRSLVTSPLSQRLDSTYYSITRTPSRTQPKFLLTSTRNNDEGMKKKKREKYFLEPLREAKKKFLSRPGTYIAIPFIAAFVGWFTNWLAVQMIFYPVKYRGLPIYRWKGVPLGLIGWQGIVPCKTVPMTEAMVEMVTTQLLSIQDVFRRLDPRKVAQLLAPEVPKLGMSIVEDIVQETVPKSPSSLIHSIISLPKAIIIGLPSQTKDLLNHFNHQFLRGFTVAMQDNIDKIFNIRNCVVEQMVLDRAKLGQLFQKCGEKELEFLTNSGLWFGFILGLIQMVVALFWDNPWSLSIGGGIVGLATNWLALKWIFEPVNPTKVGPFILQGQFLRRQKEVAKEFSSFFANQILTSEKMFHSIMNDSETGPVFQRLFSDHLLKFASTVSGGLKVMPEPEVMKMAASRAIEKLPQHLGVLHSYVDETLNLETSLRIAMEKMSSVKFERVLHPIFEEDELTLILAGAALGFAAGLVQQGLETGQIKLPNLTQIRQGVKSQTKKLTNFMKVSNLRKQLKTTRRTIMRPFQQRVAKKDKTETPKTDSE